MKLLPFRFMVALLMVNIGLLGLYRCHFLKSDEDRMEEFLKTCRSVMSDRSENCKDLLNNHTEFLKK